MAACLPSSRPRLLLSLPLWATLAIGCQAPPASLGDPRAPGNQSLADDYRLPAQTGVGRQEHAITVGDGPNHEQILYINFDGATITRVANNGTDDARLNQVWLPDTVPIGQSVVIPAFDASPYPLYTADTAKAFIVDQVKTWYQPFNVLVTTTRPSAPTKYTMMMVGGVVESVLMSPGSAVGVATLDCGNSMGMNSQVDIGFAFAASLAKVAPAPNSLSQQQTVLYLVAQTVAHEAGHTFGLEHVTNNHDIMVSAVDPAVTGFLDANNTLTGGASQCPPASSTENTYQRLLNNLGPNPNGMSVTLPNVAFLAPKNGDVVPRGFTVAVSASQPAGAGGSITKVDLVQAGATVASLVTPPYRALLNATGDGSFTISAVAYNSLGGKNQVQVTFTVQDGAVQKPIGCLINTDCMAGQMCTGGSCVAAPVTCNPACGAGEICQDGSCMPDPNAPDMSMPMTSMPTPTMVGKSCLDSAECGTGGVCATNSGKKFCTMMCDPAGTTCPADYECAAIAGAHYCSPASSGCSTAGPGSTPRNSAPLALMLLAFAFLRRRSRTSAT